MNVTDTVNECSGYLTVFLRAGAGQEGDFYARRLRLENLVRRLGRRASGGGDGLGMSL